MLTVSQLKQAYAYGATTAFKTANYDDPTAQAMGAEMADEAEGNPTGVQLMGPTPGAPLQPDENSLVEGDYENANEQEVSPEAHADVPSDDIYGALSE
jgi:hypothetical protein